MADRPDLEPGSDDYLNRWSQLHGGVPAVGLVGLWVRVSRALAAPLARAGLPPDLVSLAGVAVALLVAVPAAGGGRWLLLAAALVGLSGLLDGVDGAVAVLSGRPTAWGSVLDSSADRLTEAGYGLALWLAGGPGWLAVLAVAIGWLHEYVRARAGAVGMPGVAGLTVAERPTRVIVVAMFLLAGGILAESAAGWVTAGAAVWAAAGLVGLIQLLILVRHRLR